VLGKLKSKLKRFAMQKGLAMFLSAAAEGRLGPQVKAVYWWLVGKKTVTAAILGFAAMVLFFGDYTGFCTSHGWDCHGWLASLVAISMTLFTLGLTDAALRMPAPFTDPAAAAAAKLDQAAAKATLKVLLVAVLLGSSLACATAQVRFGPEPRMHPDGNVVRGYVCTGDEDAARLYLENPTFAWIGPAKERYLMDAKMDKLRGACPCPGKSCPQTIPAAPGGGNQ